jgi:hypothetical protein
MILAELTIGGDGLAGGGLGAMLIGFATLLVRRTKDTDEMRERLMQTALEAAHEREELSRLDVTEARAETQRLRSDNHTLRQQIQQLRHDLRTARRGQRDE